MRHFRSIHDVPNLGQLVADAHACKRQPYALADRGRNRTLGLVFLNPSLRTRLSTQKAAYNLGMHTLLINARQDGWELEFDEKAVMNGTKAEHIQEAAGVLGRYCDFLAVRAFADLTNRTSDYAETVLEQFSRYAGVPIISLEGATRHPLQSLADLLTLQEQLALTKRESPKVVLTWAPHPRALPQAVANSFAEWVLAAGYELHIAHPEGHGLAPEFTRGAVIHTSQEDALSGADFIYVKNWSAYEPYGQRLEGHADWMLTEERLQVLAPSAQVMHCLPVRREVELASEVLNGPRSLVLAQAENRVYAAQAVLLTLLNAQT